MRRLDLATVHMLGLVLSLALAAPLDIPVQEPPAAPDLHLHGDEDPDASVYRVGATDAVVTGLAMAGSIVPDEFPRLIDRRRCEAAGGCSASSVNAFDRFAIGLHDRGAGFASDVTVGLSVAVPAVADAFRLGFTPALGEDETVLAETVAVNAAIVTGVKFLVQRPLPATYAGRDGLPREAQGYRSFYSGHTSTAVAALTASAWTLHLRDGPQAWPWIVTGLAGASVAAERVLAGRHFPTDVLAGAAAGFGVGTLVPWLHARRKPWRRFALRIVPDGRGLALGGSF